jgi:hypothetical protein
MSRSARSCFAVLLLAFLLLPAGLQAANASRNAEAHQGGFVDPTAWDILARVWNLLTGSVSDNGCGADPDDRCPIPETIPTLDTGCTIEPDGRCQSQRPTTTADNGCSLEPDGRCAG